MADLHGTVKWFNRIKGFGFITPDVGDAEVFLHYSALTHEEYLHPFEGDRIVYELVEGEKGPQAANVRYLDEE